MMFLLIKCMGRSPLRVFDASYNQFKFKKLNAEDMDEKLTSIDELRVSRKYKFGIMYSETNQHTEDEILSNSMSPLAPPGAKLIFHSKGN